MVKKEGKKGFESMNREKLRNGRERIEEREEKRERGKERVRERQRKVKRKRMPFFLHSLTLPNLFYHVVFTERGILEEERTDSKLIWLWCGQREGNSISGFKEEERGKVLARRKKELAEGRKADTRLLSQLFPHLHISTEQGEKERE